MITPITTALILSLHEDVRKTYPEDVVGGHIDRQAIDGIVSSAFLEYDGKPVHDTIFKQAAALMEGIIRLHPFPDGNKRTALLAAWGFLLVSDHYLVTPLDTIRFMVDVAKEEGRTGEEIGELVERMAVWLEKRTATTSTDHKTLAYRYITKPARKLFLASLTIVGMIYAHRRLKYWLASDTHPQYAKDKWRTVAFLCGLTFGADKWIKRNESTVDVES